MAEPYRDPATPPTPTELAQARADGADARERAERVGTISLLLVAAVVLQAMHAPEAVVGGAVSSAITLAMPGGGSRTRLLVGSGAGALAGALLGGWIPTA